MNEVNYRVEQSLLFKQVKSSRVKLNTFMTVLIYFVLWLLGLFLGRIIANFIMSSLQATLTLGESIAVGLRRLIVSGTQILLFFLWVGLIEKRSIKTIGFQSYKPFKEYTTGFMVGFSAISVVTIILYLFRMVEFKSYNFNFAPVHIVAIAFGWIVQSASEEIAIRGWLIPSLGSQRTPTTAIVLTAIIFGILHLFSAGVTVLSFINLILSGVFFAGYAIYTNNIWGVCGLHFAWNFTLGNIYGFPVSGFSSNGEAIMTMKQVGSTFFTGGDFGPEGSFITTIILLVGISILGLISFKKNVQN
jgi:membrane protease YdiL (CAAX protease family)